MPHIYKITNPKGKIYIGQGLNGKKRLSYYKSLSCKNQPKILNSLKKYGPENHKFEILCECTVDQLDEMENYYGGMFDVLGENGLNCRLPKGKGTYRTVREESKHRYWKGKKRNPETNKVISEKLKKYFIENPEALTKMSEQRKGKKFTPEWKQNHLIGIRKNRHKISAALIGQKRRAKLVLNLETGIFYDSAKEAGESVNIKRPLFCNMINGKKPFKTSKFIYA